MPGSTPVPQYYIQAGVRRSVAAREAGLIDIPAVIYELGHAPIFTRLLLSQLHSPKPSIPRDGRYMIHTEYPTRVLKTAPPPIEVELLGQPLQMPSVPLLQVLLT